MDHHPLAMLSLYDFPTVQDYVKQMVAITEKLDQIWKQDTQKAKYVAHRFFGSIHGFLRLYPGAIVPKDYDHTKRRWLVAFTCRSLNVAFELGHLSRFNGAFVQLNLLSRYSNIRYFFIKYIFKHCWYFDVYYILYNVYVVWYTSSKFMF